MPGNYAQHNDTVQAFHTWRQSPEAQSPGIRGLDLDTECQYIPKSKLEGYLDRRKVDELLHVVLDSHHRLGISADYIRDHYLRTFAILLCIGQADSISYFAQHNSLRDTKLPHRTQPSDFPTLQTDVFEKFKKTQWQFCASRLEYDMDDRFKEDEILPITRKEKIGEGGSATVYRVVVDEEYNSLRPRGQSTSHCRQSYKNTFVLKTYRIPEAEKDYRAERNAFMTLRFAGNPPPNIVAYYGGFVHGNLYNTILEYADSGTLEDFIRTTKPPVSIEDCLLFWHRLFGITDGIMAIHGQIPNLSKHSASQYLNGRHQDIRPANILVFSGNGVSPYDYHFKIADLGLSTFQPNVAPLNEPSDLDPFGTRAYGAPETCRSHKASESSHLQVTPSVDIWSIGAILSEVSLWMHDGWPRVTEYRERRSAEILRNGGTEGEQCFHDGAKILDVVESVHEELLRRGSPENYATRLVLERLVKEMLQVQAVIRPSALHVHAKARRTITDCERRFEVSVNALESRANSYSPISDAGRSEWRPTSAPEQISPLKSFPSAQHHPSVEAEYPQGQPLPPDDDLSPIQQASRLSFHDYSSSQNSQPRHADVDEIPRSSDNQLPHPPQAAAQSRRSPERQSPQQPEYKEVLSFDEGLEWMDQCKTKRYRTLLGREKPVLSGRANLPALNRRDHIFLIDNSVTMKRYKSDVERLTSLLAYILKNTDENGLDVYFTQSSSEINTRKSSYIARSIRQEVFEGRSDMRAGLRRVLQQHIDRFGTEIPQKSKLFGRRLPPRKQRPLSVYVLTDAQWQNTDVNGFIKDMVQSMKRRECPKEHVGISFIRFGENPTSIKRLNELDQDLDLAKLRMDIIDHIHFRGNIWKMLLGPINEIYDDDRREH